LDVLSFRAKSIFMGGENHLSCPRLLKDWEGSAAILHAALENASPFDL
jgi:hypothetical protein